MSTDSRRSRNSVLMSMAETLSDRATCTRRQVGALIVRDSRVISTGYNGAPAGLPHCNHRLNELPSAGCQRAVHAEANAIVFAARNGIATEGATIFTTLSPCYECAKLIINAGITQVWYDTRYRDPAGLELLDQAGVLQGRLTWS